MNLIKIGGGYSGICRHKIPKSTWHELKGRCGDYFILRASPLNVHSPEYSVRKTRDFFLTWKEVANAKLYGGNFSLDVTEFYFFSYIEGNG